MVPLVPEAEVWICDIFQTSLLKELMQHSDKYDPVSGYTTNCRQRKFFLCNVDTEMENSQSPCNRIKHDKLEEIQQPSPPHPFMSTAALSVCVYPVQMNFSPLDWMCHFLLSVVVMESSGLW